MADHDYWLWNRAQLESEVKQGFLVLTRLDRDGRRDTQLLLHVASWGLTSHVRWNGAGHAQTWVDKHPEPNSLFTMHKEG